MGKVLQEEELHISKALKVGPAMCLLLQEESIFIDWHCQSGILCAFSGGLQYQRGMSPEEVLCHKAETLLHPGSRGDC